MTKILLKGLALAVVGSFVLVANSYATPINGSIGMAGTWKDTGGNTANSNLSDATGIDFKTATVLTADFDLAPLVGQSITMTDFTFNPFPVAGVVPLWTKIVGTDTYSFDLTSLTVDVQNSSQINLSGTGTFSVTGFDPTPGEWTWTGNALGTAFTWSDSATVVPEPATMLLFGAGLAGLAGVRRKMTK